MSDPVSNPMDSPTITRERRTKKRVLRLGLIIPMLALAAAAVLVSSAIMASIVSDQETLEIFTDAAVIPPELLDEIVWLEDPNDLPREMEPLTRIAVTSSWIRAWEQMEIVAKTGDTSGVEVYFSGSARKGVLERAGQWSGRSVSQVGHDLQLTFYSEDGQVIGLSSVDSHLLRNDVVDDVNFVRETRESYDAVLVLEDGNWRIQHWVRRSLDGGSWTVSS